MTNEVEEHEPAIPVYAADAAAPFEVPPEGFEWVVAHTRPRCEKKLERFCGDEHFFCWLPTRRKTHMYGGRRREFLVPLFTGYLFCVVPATRRYYLRQNRYVANVLEVHDPLKLVRVLNDLRVALETGAEAEVMPYIHEGQTVRVVSGPMKGVEGIIVEIRGNAQVVLNLDMFRQSVAFPIDISCIGPAV